MPLNHLKPVMIFLGIFFATSHKASAGYYDRKAEGWHWYEDIARQPPPQEVPKQEKEMPSLKDPPRDPLVRLEAFKKKVERFKAIAVLNPTYANVKAYMEIQKVLMDHSTQFAQRWMEVVYTTPFLDYTVHHPTSQAGRHVYLDQQTHTMASQIKALSKTYGLFFFYSTTCEYCKQFAPIVRSFSQKYHWEVLPISLDGNVLPEFLNTRRDNGTAKALGVAFLPTLLAVEPKTGHVIPLGNGMLTQDQIEDRIRVLLLKGGAL